MRFEQTAIASTSKKGNCGVATVAMAHRQGVRSRRRGEYTSRNFAPAAFLFLSFININNVCPLRRLLVSTSFTLSIDQRGWRAPHLRLGPAQRRLQAIHLSGSCLIVLMTTSARELRAAAMRLSIRPTHHPFPRCASSPRD